MALAMDELKAMLAAEEPDYKKLAALLQPDDLPQLTELVKGDDAMLASKAAYCISLVHDEAALGALETASASPIEAVRVASAAGLKNLRGFDVKNVAERLLADADVGVRKLAIKSAASLGASDFEPTLRELAAKDSEPGIRSLAQTALNA
jgi:HEAT repeat protein